MSRFTAAGGNFATALADVMSSNEHAVTLGHGRHEEDLAYPHPKRTTEGFAAIYRELDGGK